jgi:hypothetical protein
MTDTTYAVILVYSTSHALKSERTLEQASIECKLIPVPRQLSSDCGVCVRVERDDTERACKALQAARVEIEGVHHI